MDSIMKDMRKDEPKKEELAPPDRFYLVYILFFFFGLAVGLPGPLFLRAQDYWFYKFRDTSSDLVDPKNRTSLQTNFASLLSVFDTVPSLVATVLVGYYGYLIKARTKILCSLSIICGMAIIFTIFVKINTDAWQQEFFILTLSIAPISSVAVITFTLSNLVFLSRFPFKYLKSYLYGDTIASVVAIVLQLIALSVGSDSINSGLIYFSCGTFLLLFTLFLAIISKDLPLYKYYMGDANEDLPKPNLTRKQLVKMIKDLLPHFLGVMTVIIFAMGGIAYYVTSEFATDSGHSSWGDKYFVPIITFLLNDIFAFIGRFFAGPHMTRKNAKWIIPICFTIMAFLGIFLLFCNAQPRHHLPVWFPHDWQYAVIICCHAVLANFLLITMFLSINNMVEPEKREIGYLVLMTFSQFFGRASAFLSMLWIRII